MFKVMTTKKGTRAVAMRQRIGTHDVREICVWIRRILPQPEAGDVFQTRTPNVVAETDQKAAQPHIVGICGFLPRSGLPQIQRCDRQNTVGLLTTT
jgi:hypothetical protein